LKTGVMFYAINNGHYDYLKIAAWNADNVRRWLDVEVAVVTNEQDVPDKFDHVIKVNPKSTNERYFPDLQVKGNWYNTNRVDAFELTPFDRTLVVDVDYVICSPDLNTAIQSEKDFLCFKNAYDVTMSAKGFNDLNYFGEHNFPMSWATVMAFNQSKQSKYIFESMRMIRDKWEHYRNIYKITRKDFRNDYALSIALGIVSGHTNKIDYIPYQLATVPPEVKIKQINQDEYYLTMVRNNKPTWLSLKAIDFHAMSKSSLEQLIDNK